MEDGWIKIFRRFLDWEWYEDGNMVRLYLHLLLKANYEDKKWRGMVVKRGQLVTSSLTLAEETHTSRQRVRTCLARLEQTGEITIKSTNKYTVITICKFDDYQRMDTTEQPTTNQQATSKQPTTNHQLTINQPQHKNIRNKERKNNISLPYGRESACADAAAESGLQKFVDFFNKSADECGSVMPRLKSVRGQRAASLRDRLRENGEAAVYEAIGRAAASDFLNGKNQHGWTASFDWLLRPNNFPKVLEGNYDNKKQNSNDTAKNHTGPGWNRGGTVTGFKIHRSGG